MIKMESKKQQTKIIKNWGDAKDGEDMALTDVKVTKGIKIVESRIDGFPKNNVKPCCCVAKNILQWKSQNPKKTVLIGAACVLFVFGITSLVIMHEMLGRNIPKSFLNMTQSFDMNYQHTLLDQNSSFFTAINGHWVEDYDQRENMDSYLKEMGMAWFKRSYASSVRWEDELLLYVQGDIFTMNGLRGPFAEAYEYTAKTDNHTINKMDIGDFGGITNAITEINEDSMVSYVFKPGSSNEFFFTVTLTIDMHNVNVLKVQYRHVDSNVVWKEVFERNVGNNGKKEDTEEKSGEKDDEEEDIWGDEDDGWGDEDDWK